MRSYGFRRASGHCSICSGRKRSVVTGDVLERGNAKSRLHGWMPVVDPGWLPESTRKPGRSPANALILRGYCRGRVASGSGGFPDFGAHASDLSGHRHPHWLYARKEPKISMGCQHRRIFSVPFACRFEALIHPALLPRLCRPPFAPLMSNRSREYYMLRIRLSTAQYVEHAIIRSRSDRPNDHVQRRCPSPAGPCLAIPCRLPMGHRCAAARSRRDAKRLACVYIL